MDRVPNQRMEHQTPLRRPAPTLRSSLRLETDRRSCLPAINNPAFLMTAIICWIPSARHASKRAMPGTRQVSRSPGARHRVELIERSSSRTHGAACRSSYTRLARRSMHGSSPTAGLLSAWERVCCFITRERYKTVAIVFFHDDVWISSSLPPCSSKKVELHRQRKRLIERNPSSCSPHPLSCHDVGQERLVFL